MPHPPRKSPSENPSITEVRRSRAKLWQKSGQSIERLIGLDKPRESESQPGRKAALMPRRKAS